MIAMPRLIQKSIKILMWKFLRGGATVIPGATFIPDSRVSHIELEHPVYHIFRLTCYKGQIISKANCQAIISSKKQMKKFIFTTMQCVFVPFLEEIEDSKKAFRNYLTFIFFKAFLKKYFGL